MSVDWMSTEPERERRARVFSALGDANRLAVVELLQAEDLSPDALAAALDMPGNLLSHHLKVLQTAGVVTRGHSQHDRRRTYVQLADGALADVLPQPRMISTPRVVFVCTHNSARSVLAEAIWRTVSDVPSASAGTHPADHINPRAAKAARRAGLTLETAAPRSIERVLHPNDLVVSVCDSVNEELPNLANPRIHWSIPDPARINTDAAFNTALSTIRERVERIAPHVSLHRRSRIHEAPA